MVFDVGETLCVPFVPFVPLHPPLAVQEVASVLLQERVEELPETIELGAAESNTVGSGIESAVTETIVDWVAEPPVPEQVRV